jgi:hypothetical protein
MARPFEKYDMIFNGAVSTRMPTTSPGRWAGQDNGWVMSLIQPAIIDFNKSIIKYPNIRRIPAGSDLLPNLQHPENPVPLLAPNKPPRGKAVGG